MTAVYSLAEVEKHNVEGDLWMIIHGKVYDVSTFAQDHPGGDDAIYEEAGKDASVSFEDVGHSDEARELLEKFYIGDLEVASAPVKKVPESVTQIPDPKPNRSSSLLVIIPAIIVVGAIVYKFVIVRQ